ncbi:glycosyltransferase family 2 protein [Lapidilactobacillus gannanensis]|uniref:glycosyltransferase family 2 protein n=1 Tax=Lapidilactobacillus gannanensis TaxID=2486002 RepID=UPI0013DE6C47|nr:glycosyltransferase family 2 protein [Lapidilactobacillus gannanensis]
MDWTGLTKSRGGRLIKSKVSIIILNYNNFADTIECLKNVRQIDYDNFEIIIVDNHSTDHSIMELRKSIQSNEVLLPAQINYGYAAGNNIGIKYALNQGTDYLCILNNDVEVDKHFLTVMVDTLEKHTEIGIAGPKICDYYDRNRIQSAGAMVNMNLGRATDLYKGQKISEVSQKILSCDYVGGACLVVRASAIDKAGLIPENYFLFYEENEWCAHFKQHGYQVAGLTEATVWHKGSHTIGKISGLSEYFMYRNLVIFIKRNGNLKNKIIFNLYFIAFCLKSLFTKKNGIRFFKYYCDGLTGKNSYQYLQK